MATKHWDGSTDGNWQTAANWTAAGVPAAADIVIFDGRTTQAVTDGIARGETGGEEHTLVHVKPDYPGDIGTPAEWFHCDATKFIFEGSGTCYLEVAGAADAEDADIATVICNSSSGTLYVRSHTNSADNICSVTNLIVNKGTCYLADDSYAANIYLVPVSNNSSNATLYIGINCLDVDNSLYPSIYMYNGTCYCHSKCTLIDMKAGTFRFGQYVEVVAFTTGAHEPVVGETLTGSVGAATAVVEAYHVTSGTWGGSNAAGYIFLNNKSGTFEAENLKDSDLNVVAAIAGATALESDLDITTLRLYGGTFYWTPEDSGGDAYISDAYIYGGTFNASENIDDSGASAAKDLGAGAGNDIYVFEGAALNIANGRGNITIATDSQLWNLGGTITTDNYAELGISYDQA